MRLSTWACHDSAHGGKGLQAEGKKSGGPLCDTRATQWETRACLKMFKDVLQFDYINAIGQMSQAAARQAWELSLTQLGVGDNLAQDT